MYPAIEWPPRSAVRVSPSNRAGDRDVVFEDRDVSGRGQLVAGDGVPPGVTEQAGEVLDVVGEPAGDDDVLPVVQEIGRSEAQRTGTSNRRMSENLPCRSYSRRRCWSWMMTNVSMSPSSRREADRSTLKPACSLTLWTIRHRRSPGVSPDAVGGRHILGERPGHEPRFLHGRRCAARSQASETVLELVGLLVEVGCDLGRASLLPRVSGPRGTA